MIGWLAGGVPVTTVAVAIAGVLLDRWYGEPRRWHPLVGFGRYASWLEARLNRGRDLSPTQAVPSASRMLSSQYARGVFAWTLAVGLPVASIWVLLSWLPIPLQLLAHGLLLAFALGGKSLDLHIEPIGAALAGGDLPQARRLCSRIVSRDLDAADEAAVARAAVESALENGSDAVLAALFWFLLAGGPGALAYRLMNTLDAMWGYKTPRFLAFGWMAARADDVVNWPAARCTALSYAALGASGDAIHCWRTQAHEWESPNAGPVMAAGAGALRVRLGGAASYHGATEYRPILGCGAGPTAADIPRALRLVRRATVAWLVSSALLTLASIPW